MRQPRPWLSALLFFLYVGAEASLGTWAFSLLTEARGLPESQAGFVTGGEFVVDGGMTRRMIYVE